MTERLFRSTYSTATKGPSELIPVIVYVSSCYVASFSEQLAEHRAQKVNASHDQPKAITQSRHPECMLREVGATYTANSVVPVTACAPCFSGASPIEPRKLDKPGLNALADN